MPIENIADITQKSQLKKLMGNYIDTIYEQPSLQKITSVLTDLSRDLPGIKRQIASFQFGAGNTISGFVGGVNGLAPDGDALSDHYTVKVLSTSLNSAGRSITAALQDKIALRATSEWAPFVPLDWLSNAVNAVSQAATGMSLLVRFTSRRIWKGTSPVAITLTLKFEAVESAYNDVIIPCRDLLWLCLPDELQGSMKLLIPPGPSAFYSTETINRIQAALTTAARLGVPGAAELSEHLTAGDRITIYVGKYLLFDSVIIKEVTPIFDTRVDEKGYPIGATVNVTFETYEILTKTGLEKVFRG